jgi:exodeoxyribonuclease VII large subunit
MTAERRKYLEQIASRPVLKNPERYIDDRRMDLVHLDTRLTTAMGSVKDKKTASFSLLAAKLDALSPLSVLTRGYSFVSDTDGRVQKKASGLTLGQSINVSFSDGSAKCKVEEIKVTE